MSPGISRRRMLELAGSATAVAAGAVLFGRTSASADPIARRSAAMFLVQQGTPTSIIVVPDGANDQVSSAAQTLSDYVQRATGTGLPIITQAAAATDSRQNRVMVGCIDSADTSRIQPRLTDLDDDGYVLDQPSSTGRLTIIGPTSWGTQFGVFDVLESRLGVRWLMPGDVGTEVPTANTLVVPPTSVRYQPAFRSRLAFPMGNGGVPKEMPGVNAAWGADMRLHYRIKVSQENYLQIFPAGVYANPALPTFRPDFYPLLGGQRHLPTSATDFDWEPDFTADGIAQVAADFVLQYLENNPAEDSYSLAINDSLNFSLNNVDMDNPNLYGLPSASVAYYTFCNDVAELVAKERPDVTLGVLAYKHVAEPPPFKLHPLIMPFLTFDRFRWLRDEDRQLDQTVTERWLATASRFGWYDWTYGNPYCVPRIDFQIRAEAYAWAAGKGVSGTFVELDPNWGEASKAWTLMKLFWDPTADPAKLSQEWCTAVAGPGAKDLVAYQDLWFREWTRIANTGKSVWYDALSQGPAPGFAFPGYLDDVDLGVVSQGKMLLQQASAKAATADQQARMDIVTKAYAYHEASALSYPRSAGPYATASDAISGLGAVTQRLDESVDAGALRLQLISDFASNPDLAFIGQSPVSDGLNWSGWQPYPLLAAADYLAAGHSDGDQLRGWVQNQAVHASSQRVQQYGEMLLQVADGDLISRGQNLSFESGALSPWFQQTPVTTTGRPFATQVTNTVSVDGGHSLRTALVRGGIVQNFPVTPGFFSASIKYFTPAGQSCGDDYIIQTWQVRDASGAVTRLSRSLPVLLRDTTGSWAELRTADMLPEGTVSITWALSLYSMFDMFATGSLYLDDARIFQVAPPDGA